MAVRFAAAGDYLDNTSHGAPDNASTTVVGWVYLTSSTGTTSNYMRLNTNAGGTVTTLGTFSDGVTQRLGAPSGSFNSTYTHKVGHWAKIAYVIAGTAGTVYGADAESTAVTVATGTIGTGTPTRYAIGGRGTGDTANRWNGRCAGFKIYNRILTLDQIIVEWSQILPVAYGGLYAAYPLDNGTDDGRADYSGNGRLLLPGSTIVEDGPPIPRDRIIIRPYLLVPPQAGGAAATGAASDAAPGVTAAAGNATATGAAEQPAVALTRPTEHAAATGAASDAIPVLAVIAVAAAAAATGAANDAGITTIDSAQAESAAATGAANNAAPGVASHPGVAQGVGAAVTPAATIVVTIAGHAAATGAASNAGPSVTVAAGHAVATGAALQPGLSISDTQAAEVAAATGAAYNATPTTATVTTVQAGAAEATGEAVQPAVGLTRPAESAAGTGAAAGAAVGVGATDEVGPQAAGDARMVRAALVVAPESASATGEAYAGDADGVANDSAAAAVVAGGDGAALDPAVLVRSGGGSGGWQSLVRILRERREPVAVGAQSCPNDGEPFSVGPRGELFCKFDGFRPGR